MNSINDFSKIYQIQSDFFSKGGTLSYRFRINQLLRLKKTIQKYEKSVLDALYKDLKKSEGEAYITEVGIIYEELNFHIKRLRKWMKIKKIKTPLLPFFTSKACYTYEPYGKTLIITPWNYPFQLLMAPLIGAVSAGNTVVLKPSEYAESVSQVMLQIVNEAFTYDNVAIITGDSDVSKELLDAKWDFIFFTGSTQVGRYVYKKAAEYLTPVALELGGKSPVIVDSDAVLDITAKRVIWGKIINAGQTCVAPDYVFVHKSVKDSFIKECILVLENLSGKEFDNFEDYSRIISERHYSRLCSLIDKEKVVYGGNSDEKNNYISPTLIDSPDMGSLIMQEEIFGPLLPIISFVDHDEIFSYIKENPKPLALYYFGNKKEIQNRVINELSAGGICINDVIIHVASPYIPFGGVGESGIGKYHGQSSFEVFSHKKPIVKSHKKNDNAFRYPPYSKKLKIFKMLYKP